MLHHGVTLTEIVQSRSSLPCIRSILSISVYTGIINRKSVFIGNKYLTVACHAEIRNPHSNCQCGTYQKTCQSVSGLYHPRRRLGDVLLTHLQMPKELMVNHLQHINNSLSCQEGKKHRIHIYPSPHEHANL